METKYKVGDKVRIKSLDWYNSKKNKNGEIVKDYITLVEEMSAYCGKEVEIEKIYSNGIVVLKGTDWLWSDWMFEDDLNINTNKQQILKHIARVQAELDKLRTLCNN